MMACARAAFAARVEAPARGRHASTRVVAAQNGHVHATASAASSRAFARLGAKRSARGHVASAQAVAVNKATRSIDEMDMDPEHVTFASSDELDARCVRLGCFFRAARARAEPRGGAASAPRARRDTRNAEKVTLDAIVGHAASRLAAARVPARRFARVFVASATTPAVRRPHVTRGRNREIGSPLLPALLSARRAARFLRPAHVTTRGGTARGPFHPATTRSSCPSVPAVIDRRSPRLSLPRTSRSVCLFHVDFSRFSSPRAARRWTAPAACAV